MDERSNWIPPTQGEMWLKKFVSHVSHEFKTPLATLKLSANYLLKYRHRVSDDVVEEKLRQILMQAELLSYSVDNIARLRNAEKNKIVTSTTLLNLTQFLEKEIAEAEKRCNYSHKIQLSSSPAVEIGVDEDILRNMFSNILDNAVKFSPERRQIWVTLKKDGAFVEVEIRDEGIGIEADEIHKVFDSFYRGTNAAFIPGMGLGLTMVKQGADALKGKVDIDSRINEGTSIRIQIPVE